MRVLLDENLPQDLVKELGGHEVDTVNSLGWAGVKNGELFRRAMGAYSAFVTMDRNIEFQQHVPALAFGIVLVRAPSNRMRDLRPLVPAILEAIAAAQPGLVQRVGV